MASPIGMYVVPNCGLKLELTGSILPNTDRGGRSKNEPMKYRITSRGLPLLASSNKRTYEGPSSPVHRVNLPRVIKRNTGCPANAAYFCYIYPPEHLAEDLDWMKFESGKIDKNPENENTWAMPYIALLGGFVYFDSSYNLLAVNALSWNKTPYDLKLSGPFLPTDAALKQIRRRNRACGTILEHLHEISFAAFAWVQPEEKFNHQVLSEEFHNKHGSFMFYKEDGSAIAYCVDPSGLFIDSWGNTSSIVDAYRSIKTSAFTINDVGIFIGSKFRTEEEIEHIRHIIINIDGPRARHDFLVSIEDSKTLLHEAIKAGCDFKSIQRHLDDSESLNLDHCDKTGRTPLHYACGCYPQDINLICLLIEKNPKSVLVLDKFDRYPLHIACDNHASAEIIDMLLKADPDNTSIQQKTKLLARRPIHVALYGKLSKDAIERLLEADPSCVALTSKTLAGRLPLHIAIEQRMDTDVVKLLLETNAKEFYEDRHHSDSAIEMSFTYERANNGYIAIYDAFVGLIPLHIACWNNSSPKTIEALLDADVTNTTVDREVGPESFLRRKFHILDEDEWERLKLSNYSKAKSLGFELTETLDESDMESSNRSRDRSFDTNERQRCIFPLHIACKNGNPEVIKLLLEKEKDKRRDEDGLDNIVFQDHCGKTPLHIACQNSNDPDVIADLLNMDDNGETTQLNDELGFKAIHYACDKRDACREIIMMLLDAETRYIAHRLREGDKVIKRSTHTCEERKRSPLYLALKAGANESVIEALLHPDHFFLKGFDSNLLSVLSRMAVSNRQIQECIIEKLSERCYFGLLFFDVYSNVFALVSFLSGSQKLVLDDERDFKEPLVLMICLIVFIFRQVIHLKSQPAQFFTGMWNWTAMASIIMLSMSAAFMFENRKEYGDNNPFSETRREESHEVLLMVSGSFLVVLMIFFLKATFLPFARFVGGLLNIFSTLIPFFIVASLMLLAFAFGFMVQDDCKDDKESDEKIDLLGCYGYTLEGFFSGSEHTSDLLDVVFGFVAIIVLLNVVIAVVSDAWDSAANEAINLFWKFRLEFLCESRFYAYLDKKMCHGGRVERFSAYVDQIRPIKLTDDIVWTAPPYNTVDSKKKYDDPYDYFNPEFADKIEEAKSLQADLYWTRMESRRKKRPRAKKRVLYLKAVAKWFVFCLGYLLLFAIGLVTAGWAWPKKLRKQVLSVGLKQQHKRIKKQQDRAEFLAFSQQRPKLDRAEAQRPLHLKLS